MDGVKEVEESSQLFTSTRVLSQHRKVSQKLVKCVWVSVIRQTDRQTDSQLNGDAQFAVISL